MFKTKTTLLISLIFFGLFFIFTYSAEAEVILDFNSTINLLPDASILVQEKITYDFEKEIKYGIYRTIPLYNSKKEKIEIKNISVKNELDKIYDFTTDIYNNTLRIKIGDSNLLISGIKEYYITYQVFGSISYYSDFDEIYWNVTGNDWDILIQKVEATIILPNNIFPIKKSCYYGQLGSKNVCKNIESNIFVSDTVLGAKEGLTVAVGFPKGVVSIYHPKVKSVLLKFIETYWPLTIPIIAFVFMYIWWFKRGRDPIGKEVIIPQYDIPEGLTPLEVGGIIGGEVKNQNISAEIIYLATLGYIKIKKIDKDCNNFLCLVSMDDYEFTLLKEEGLLLNDFDRKIITTIFEENGEVGGTVRLSELRDYFYKSIKGIDNSVIDSLLKKKYYIKFPKNNITYNTISVSLSIILLFSFINSLQNSISFFDFKKIIVLIISFVLLMIIIKVFKRIMPARSMKGVSTKEHLLGLKEYLQIVEKDRFIFHNAPDKRPEIFERLLPYAMIFEVEELWAKEFSDIYTNSPSWYEGSAKFNVVSFGHEILFFSTLASSLISSYSNNSSNGGSGGGGFSGGGGGGGGGGSW